MTTGCATLPAADCLCTPRQLALAPCCIALHSVVALTDVETVNALLLIACARAGQRTNEQGWSF